MMVNGEEVVLSAGTTWSSNECRLLRRERFDDDCMWAKISSLRVQVLTDGYLVESDYDIVWTGCASQVGRTIYRSGTASRIHVAPSSTLLGCTEEGETWAREAALYWMFCTDPLWWSIHNRAAVTMKVTTRFDDRGCVQCQNGSPREDIDIVDC